MQSSHINEKLMSAIAAHDIEAVKACLAQGADPNYRRHSDDEDPDGLIQPTTPLRLVMFCISDAMLDDSGILKFAEITKLLLHQGADPKPAIQIAEYRYGKFDAVSNSNHETPFYKVWKLIMDADS